MFLLVIFFVLNEIKFGISDLKASSVSKCMQKINATHCSYLILFNLRKLGMIDSFTFVKSLVKILLNAELVNEFCLVLITVQIL